MRRRVLNRLTGVSLVLLVVVGVFWPASHWIRYDIWWNNGRGFSVGVKTHPGKFLFVRYQGMPVGERGVEWGQGWWGTQVIDGVTITLNPGVAAHQFLVFGWDYQPPYAYFTVPMWLVGLLLFPLPLHGLYRRLGRGRDRERAGLCAACGYDTRETPDQRPECGTFINELQ